MSPLHLPYPSILFILIVINPNSFVPQTLGQHAGSTVGGDKLSTEESFKTTAAAAEVELVTKKTTAVTKAPRAVAPRAGKEKSEKGADGGKGKAVRGVGAKSSDTLGPPKDNYPLFKESGIWGDKYPMCNPRNNKHLSPVKIQRGKVELDKETETLFVFSATPIATYKLSVNFTLSPAEHDNYSFHMDAVTLKLDDENFHEATHVAGVGDISYRFFQYALFLFSKSPAPPGHSVHQIDAQTFPMEIVLYFAAKSGSDDDTQVHVLVKIGELENPLFIPLIKAAEVITKRIVNMEENTRAVHEQQDVVKKMMESYEAIVSKHKEEGIHEKLKKLQQANTEASNFETNLKAAENDVIKYQELHKTLEKSIPELEESIEHNKVKLQTLTTSLEEKTKEFEEKMEDDPPAALQLKQQIEGISSALKKSEDKLHSEQAQLEMTKERQAQNELTIKEKRKAAETAHESIEHGYSSRGFTFKSTKEGIAHFHDLKHLISDEEREKSEVQKQRQKLQALMKELKTEEFLEVMQASWLMPPIGGYFYYNGSLPVPPCLMRPFTIVLEKPVEISQAQFDAIASIHQPANAEPLQTCLPPLADLGDRKVHYSKKNLQFILDDAVHMKSKRRRYLKDLAKRSGSGWRRPSTRFLSLSIYSTCFTWTLIIKVDA